jgi:hypothetical protein
VKRSRIFRLAFYFVALVVFLFSTEEAKASLRGCDLTYKEVYVSQARGGKTCYAPSSCIQKGSPITIRFAGIENVTPSSLAVTITLDSSGTLGTGDKLFCIALINNGVLECSNPGIVTPLNMTDDVSYKIKATYVGNPGLGPLGICTFDSVPTITLSQSCTSSSKCDENESSLSAWSLCRQISDLDKRSDCNSCFASSGVWTAIGCIPTSPQEIIKTIVTIGMSLAGVVVLILILISAFTLSTSQGDPNKTKEAKEMLTSAIVGLLFIIFSVTILQFIGVSILNIPGFGE